MPERHGAQRCRATCGISIGDEQQPLGGWIELMARSEEIHPARLGQPLACHRDCDVIVGVELGQHGLRVVACDNAVVDREPAGEVALHRGENVRLAVNSYEYRFAHPCYSSARYAIRRGASRRVSSV